MIIDGTNLILGRIATFAAKKALEGEQVVIVNCESIVVTGGKKQTIKSYHEKMKIGDPYKGPFLPKMPDRIVRRAIRGMLPYKKERGAKAYKRIKCFMGIPEQYKTQKTETIITADAKKLTTLKFIRINDIAKFYNKGVLQ